MEEPPTLSTLRNRWFHRVLQLPSKASMMPWWTPSMWIFCAISLVQQLQVYPTAESLYTTLKSADLAKYIYNLYLRLSIFGQFLVQADSCLVTSIILVAKHLAFKDSESHTWRRETCTETLSDQATSNLKYNQMRRLSNTYAIACRNKKLLWKCQTPSNYNLDS